MGQLATKIKAEMLKYRILVRILEWN